METETSNKVGELYQAIKELADQTTLDMTLRQALALLYVGANPSGTTQNAVMAAAGVDKSAMSRIIDFLGGVTAGIVKRKDGLGLVRRDLDKTDMRNRLIVLSPDGARVLKRVAKKLS